MPVNLLVSITNCRLAMYSSNYLLVTWYKFPWISHISLHSSLRSCKWCEIADYNFPFFFFSFSRTPDQENTTHTKLSIQPTKHYFHGNTTCAFQPRQCPCLRPFPNPARAVMSWWTTGGLLNITCPVRPLYRLPADGEAEMWSLKQTQDLVIYTVIISSICG